MDDTKRSSESLSEDTKYRLLVEAVTDYAIYMLDVDGIVTSWNSGAARFKGYTAAEILGHHFSRFYTEEDREAGLPERALATAARDGKFEGEGWRVRKDGVRFWTHVVIDPVRDRHGRLIGYAKVTRDLTERRAAEESMRRTEELFRMLVQGVTDYAIYMIDTDGRVNSWNAGAQRIKGYLPEEILGKHFSTFYRDEDRERNVPGLALEAARREGRYENEGWRVRKDGSTFWANVVIDPIRDDSGTIIGFAKITRDITDRREAQHALERARESLFQAQKLDAIGQLTGGVAHDFNNLLMVIMSSLQIIRRRVGHDPKLLALVDNAVKGARRGASLTQRMLAFARRQDLNPVPVDVGVLVEGMSDLLARSLGPLTRLILTIPPGLRAAQVDPNQLELALLNLAVNARDAMPNGGLLRISAQEDPSGPVGTKSAAAGYVRLSVTDEGEGMDEETLARATEPFFTTKGVGKGTGLGLSMVHGLASQSGGHLRLQSRKGKGTTAELWLPLANPAHDVVGGRVGPEEISASAKPLHVLAVDDDSLVLESSVAMLEELGHSTIAAASAQEALDILRHDSSVQLLLTDHAMPQMTGAELADAVRQEWPHLAVIVASGFAEVGSELPPSVIRLSKPFDHNELARAIASIGDTGRSSH